MQSTLTVYKASAGSGKTFTLAAEYITQLLSSPSKADFQHTLAVTFTNKATAEMKDRILQQLYALSKALPEGESYSEAVNTRLKERGIHLSETQLRQRTAEVLSAILHDFNHFRVETIDSFFQSIVRNLARELGLTANLEVELNSAEVVSNAVDRIIDNLQFTPDIQQWILNYVAQQIENNERWDITRRVKGFANCIFEENFQNRSDAQRRVLNDEACIQRFRKKMQEIQAQGKAAIVEKAKAVDDKLQTGVLNYERISRGTNYRSALLQIMNLGYDMEKTTLRKAVEDPANLLKGADKKDTRLTALAHGVSAMLADLLHSYSENIAQILSAKVSAQHINPLRLLGHIEDTANRICAENNQILLSRTPTLLSSLVESNDAPFVFEKIGTQLQHVMIDEFQDTSLLQWRNFRVLLLENQSVGGHDLVVGDVKQSIYRWRNGDWSVLHGIEDEMRAMRPKVVTLSTNYRSLEQVIAFNNMFFPKAAAALDSLCPEARFRIADIYADVEQQCKACDGRGYVRVQLYAKKGVQRPTDYEERFLDDMIAQIRELTALGVELSDMAVLVRKRSMATRLIEGFHHKAPDLQLVSDEAFLMSASVAVEMIVCALRVLADPSGADPVPLHYLVSHYLTDVKGQAASPEDFARKGAEGRLPQEFTAAREELVHLPLYVLCEELYRMFELSRIKGQEAYLFAFYDQLLAYLRSHPSDIRSFLQTWDDNLGNQPVPCGKIPGLRIMTIHQSKGLQFHTVFLPYTEWDIEKDRTDDLLWCDSPEAPFNELGILPVTPGKDMASSVFAPIYEEEHLQKRVDALNTLYVAFTRAECNLLIWGMTNRKFSTSALAGDLLYSVLDLESQEDEMWQTWGEPVGRQEKNRKKSENRMNPDMDDLAVPFSSFRARLDFMQSNESAKFIRNTGEETMDQQDYLELGKIMHYVLSQIKHDDDVDSCLDKCQKMGLIHDETQRDVLFKRIQSGMRNGMVRSWFAPDVQVYNECSIVSLDRNTGETLVRRPDRVVMTADSITVVDFKCGRPWPEHETQVREYMTMMSGMYPEKTVSGFLWYIYSGKIQPVDAFPGAV